MSSTRSRPGEVSRELLPHTFSAWFGRFSSLTEIQRRAIPEILAGRDVLLASATATGKTEAYAAPAAEIMLAQGRGGPGAGSSASVVIVSPTRALANDLKRRLESPMALVDVSFGRHTGEHKERVAGHLPSVIVTTPEALDSMLARRPGTLRGTRMVILDEVHVLDGTPRGDQLRVLLHRIELEAQSGWRGRGNSPGAVARGGAPQRLAASATVDRPEELARRYLVDPLVVTAPGRRKIRGRAFEGTGVVEFREHLAFLARSGFRKVLVFCKSRGDVETFASGVRGRTPFAERAYAHHGSLARSLRERNERLFLEASSAVCFATLTLEMGIDIGTVDYVLLAGIPGSVASLLQRIGRGGRRGDETRAGYAVSDPASRHVYETMLRLGARGELAGGAHAFRPEVLVQQALVLAGARSWITADDLAAVIPPEIASELETDASEIAREIIDRLVTAGHVERTGAGRVVLGASLERRHERGTLHSNIAEEPGLDVVDRLTGEVLGRVLDAPQERVQIGGTERLVVRSDSRRILTDGTRDAAPARYVSRGAPTLSFALAQEVLAAAGVPRGEIWCLPLCGAHRLLHGLGVAGGLLLAWLIERAVGKRGVVLVGAHSLLLRARLEVLPPVTPGDIESFTVAHLNRLERLTSPGPWVKELPHRWRLSTLRRLLELDRIAAHLGGATLRCVDLDSPEILAKLPVEPEVLAGL